MNSATIVYAKSRCEEKAVYIRDAANGLGCNCICFECGTTMIAVQGKSENAREWHFRHSEDSDCKGGFESAIHLLSKQIIKNNSQIEIPGRSLNYFDAKDEVALGSIIPDVTVSTDEATVHFEIVVTNPVNQFKQSYYTSKKHKCIVIDLKNLSRDTSPAELEKIVLQECSNKSIIFWETSEPVVVRKEADNLVEGFLKIIGFAFLLWLLSKLFSRSR